MVFFTCNACGESVKKVQVEKHVSICRNCECLSCIDCGKDFWGDDYKSHMKCIREDQKYGGKGYEGKAHKGDVKQQAWIQKINELIKKPNVSPKVRELLQQISAFDNVPRKKAKFQNWMKNSLKIHNESILEQVWNIFSEASSSETASKGRGEQPRAEVPATASPSSENGSVEERPQAKKNKRERKEERQKSRKKEKKELKLENHPENSQSQTPRKRRKGQEPELGAGGAETPRANGSAGRTSTKKGPPAAGGDAGEGHAVASAGKRKRKISEAETEPVKKKKVPAGHSEGGEPGDQEAPAKGKFNWKGTIKAVLRQAPDNELSVKKLRKKVLAQYYTVMNESHRSEEDLLVIFNKKVSMNPTFRLLKDRVKLLA